MSSEEEFRVHDERLAIYNFGKFIGEGGIEDLEHVTINFRDGYPDAELYLKFKNGEEIHLNVEFEGRSSNFKLHKHDASKCDLIVCTLHDWKDAPVPVLDPIAGKIFYPGESIEGSFYWYIKNLKRKNSG